MFILHLTFTATSLTPSSFFLHSLERSLSVKGASLCQRDITEEECLSALRGFKNSKSPGIDGLPYEFLDSHLTNVFNDFLLVARYHFLSVQD